MNFRELLNAGKTILLDGAMGTELEKQNLQGQCDVNLTHPDIVIGIHRQYFRAGSRAVITNTLTLNRVYAAAHRLPVDLDTANRAGAALAREAAPEGCFVLGDISTTGRMLMPDDTSWEGDFSAAFREQATSLAEAGVDGLIIETMYDLREAICALRACRSISDLPVLVSMDFNTDKKGGRTIMGNSAEECASHLTEEGADVVGANCGSLLPDQMARIIAAIHGATSLPILAEPNAGKPLRRNEQTVFTMSPEEFAQGILGCHQAGATVLGGGCGTTPEHIQAMADIRL